MDIAGLVEGASKGEGLGNKFLSHIREVDAVIHMIRCFDSDDIQNVNPTVDPIRDLETYFTSGPEETRAWTIQKNCTAPKAAGEIHTDFEKGFIRAETVSYQEFIKNSGWLKSKNNGKMRLEGKDYIVKDGDVLNFRFNT